MRVKEAQANGSLGNNIVPLCRGCKENSRTISYQYGDIFVTMESSFLGYRHGHAGIGGWYDNTVIEANPGDGVKLYNNRVTGYWHKVKGFIMRPHGSTERNHLGALQYAERQLGKKYGFNAFDSNDFYCSELVYYAWDSQGFSIVNKRNWWGGLILPAHIIDNPALYKTYVSTGNGVRQR